MMETEENREKVFVLSNAFIKLRISTNRPGLNYLETFRLWDENYYQYENFSKVSSARVLGSVILAGNVVAVVILVRVWARVS